MMADIQKLRRNLEQEGFQTAFFETGVEASAYLNRAIDGQTVGFGGSVTVQELGLFDSLSTHNACTWHWENGALTDAADAAVYICSLNGVSENGELINIDGSGNRLASGLMGHERVYFVIGVNKIAPDWEQALWRARNIAAPKNAKRLGRNTPCAIKADKCYNCHSEECICRALLVYRGRPKLIDHMEVVIINETLGL